MKLEPASLQTGSNTSIAFLGENTSGGIFKHNLMQCFWWFLYKTYVYFDVYLTHCINLSMTAFVCKHG